MDGCWRCSMLRTSQNGKATSMLDGNDFSHTYSHHGELNRTELNRTTADPYIFYIYTHRKDAKNGKERQLYPLPLALARCERKQQCTCVWLAWNWNFWRQYVFRYHWGNTRFSVSVHKNYAQSAIGRASYTSSIHKTTTNATYTQEKLNRKNCTSYLEIDREIEWEWKK